jgi:hypothetical protein
MKKTEPLTIAALSRLTGSQRKDISRWLDDAGLTLADGKKRCLACIRDHQDKSVLKIIVDPKSGLTYRQSLNREQAVKLRRDNDATEARMNRDWITASRHSQVINSLCDRLASVPDTIKEKLALTDEQHESLRKVFEDIFAEFRQVTPGSTARSSPPPANAGGPGSDFD